VLLASPLVVLVPPGEAPDEPAHAAYVDHLLEEGRLPSLEEPARAIDYEAYQPPLSYFVMAGTLRLAGFESLDHPFEPDPEFAFQRNRRVFRPASPSPAVEDSRHAFHLARAANLVWLALASASILSTCLRITPSTWAALGAGAPFALAPQLLFAGSTLSNDAALVALSTAATAGLVVLLSSPHTRPALAASTFAGLALWVKASAVVIAPAIALVLVWLLHAGRRREALALFVPGFAISLGWAGFELWRTGTLLPNPPTGWAGGSGLGRLFTEPDWVLSAWGSFWAKLGWFNVVFPWPAYLAFVPATLLTLFGLITALRSRSKAGAILGTIFAAAVCLLMLYMVRIDWQPQGRYLLPATAALAGLAALGLGRLLENRPAVSRYAALASCCVSIAVAVATSILMLRVY